MNFLRITLRFVFCLIAAFYFIDILSHIFKSDMEFSVEWILGYSILFVQLPAVLLLIILSIYSYLSKGVLWSFFKVEYYIIIAIVSLLTLEAVIEAICNCNL
jgi:hypothetical protein